ncbi:MAG: DUF1049 domain-containing protein [Nitrospirae bacterium]|nr:MAG: DUF1049 domain-containing protein [Nitrospirota bacterium]
MGKIVTIIFLLLAGFMGYIAYYNMEPVSVALSREMIYQIPKIVLILLSAAFGAVFMIVIYTMRDTRRLIKNIQTQRKQKRQEKIQNHYSKALSAIHSGKVDVAETSLLEILKEDSSHLQALLRLGEIAEQKGDLKGALDYYKRALASLPGDQETLLHMITVKEKLGAYEEALGYADEILEKDPRNLPAIEKKRTILERLERWDDLVEFERVLVKKASSDSERKRHEDFLNGYMYESGRIALEKGDIDKARRQFRAVLKNRGDFIPAHLGLTEAILQEDGREAAISYLEKVMKDTRSLIVLARLEDLILEEGEPARLINIYKRELSESPTDNQLKFFLAKLYYRLEMLDDALELIEGIESPSNFPEIKKIRGGIYMKRGQFEKATTEFREALNMKMTLKIPYCCSACGYTTDEWSGRCPSCKTWNSFYFNVHGACKVSEQE